MAGPNPSQNDNGSNNSLVWIVVLLAVGALGWWGWQNMGRKPAPAAVTSAPRAQAPPQQAPPPPPAAEAPKGQRLPM